jgi:hypothetical protein
MRVVGVGVGSLLGSRYVIGPLWDTEILPWEVLPNFFAAHYTAGASTIKAPSD